MVTQGFGSGPERLRGQVWGNPWRRAFAAVAVATMAFLVLGGFEAWHDSATFDEPVYVSSGLVAVLHHDLSDNSEHPPLFKVLAALPVLVEHPVIPPGNWNHTNERAYGAAFVKAQLEAHTMRRVTFTSRLVPLLEAALVALAVFALACTLFGPASGIIAALLWLADPVVLGLGHLDGVDLPFALTTVLVALALVRWLRVRDFRRLVVLGLACGATASAQVTGLLVAALAVGVVVAASRRRPPRGWILWRAPLAVVATAWAVVWVVYIALDPGVVLHSSYLLPAPYVDGIRFLASNDTVGAPGFLLGSAWTGANPWFWPASLLVKVPTPILLVWVAGPVVVWRAVRSKRFARREWRELLVAVLVPAVVLFAFELPGPRTLGVRYLLPSIALWTVVGSGAVVASWHRLAVGAVWACLVLAAVVTVVSAPDSLASTAPPFTPAYRVATDSNVDWGQDLTDLTQWSRTRHPYVAYFGPRGITQMDIPGSRRLLGVRPGLIRGWVAVSATDLTSALRGDPLDWLRAYCPIGTLGGSIVLYRFDAPPTSAPGPVTPAPLCGSGASRRIG